MKLDKNKLVNVLIVAMIVIIVFSVIVTTVGGGCKGIQQKIKHFKSATVGIDRKITLYANDGSVIRTWEGQIQVESQDGIPRFIIDNKTVQLNGTYVIEEK